MKELKTDIRTGDCLEILKKFPDDFFDLIVTSPPYADSRSKTYGGIKPDKYVEWFLPRSKQFLRVLKPTGTFILNIKERVVNSERHTYEALAKVLKKLIPSFPRKWESSLFNMLQNLWIPVFTGMTTFARASYVIELILEMRKQGWLWTEEFIWHKKNCHPGKWPNRFRDAWERCLQFNKTKEFNMYQKSVMVPMGDWADKRLKNLGKNDVVRFNSNVGSGFGKNVSNWIGRTMAYPTNVLHLPTETSNRNHSATFPKALPTWFINLFTKEYDWVLDPFLGAGTTCEAVYGLKRNSVGIEIASEYAKMSKERIPEIEYLIADKGGKYARNNKERYSSIAELVKSLKGCHCERSEAISVFVTH